MENAELNNFNANLVNAFQAIICATEIKVFFIFLSFCVCVCVSLSFGQIYRLICLFIDLQNVKMHPTKRLNIAHQNAVHRLVFDVVTVLALMKGHDVTEMSIVSTNPMRITCCAVIQKVADHHQQRLLPQQLDHLQVMLIQQRLYLSCHHSILHQVKKNQAVEKSNISFFFLNCM